MALIPLLMITVPLLFRGEEQVSFNAPEGSVTTITVIRKGTKKVVDSALMQDGVKTDSPNRNAEVDDEMRVSFRDTVLSLKDHRVLKAQRTYTLGEWKDIERHGPPGFVLDKPIETTENSPLERWVVTFDWNPDQKRYLRTASKVRPFIEKVDVQSQLSMLVPSFNYDVLSPSNVSKAGESWSIPASKLRDLVLMPGGQMYGVPKLEEGVLAVNRVQQRIDFWNSISGVVHATVADPTGDAERDVVLIKLSGDVELDCKTSMKSEQDGPYERSISERAKIEGVARWSVSRNRLDGVELDWKGAVVLTQPVTVHRPVVTQSGILNMKFDNQAHWEMKCSYEDPNSTK